MDLEKLKGFFKKDGGKDDVDGGASQNPLPPNGASGALQGMILQRMMRQKIQKMGGDPNVVNGKMGALMDVVKEAGQRKFADSDEMVEFLITRLSSSFGKDLSPDEVRRAKEALQKRIPGSK